MTFQIIKKIPLVFVIFILAEFQNITNWYKVDAYKNSTIAEDKIVSTRRILQNLNFSDLKYFDFQARRIKIKAVENVNNHILMSTFGFKRIGIIIIKVEIKN